MLLEEIQRVSRVTVAQVLGYLTLAALMLITADWSLIAHKLGLRSTILSEGLAELLVFLSPGLNNQLAENIARIIFFAGIALTAYVILLAIINFVVEAKNEATIRQQYTNQGAAALTEKPIFRKGIVATGFICILIISGNWLLPWSMVRFGEALMAIGLAKQLWLALTAWAGLSLNLYLIWIGFRLIFRV